jgi:aromatic ring-opening dioxygenase catalytic subunit (LigB family)
MIAHGGGPCFFMSPGAVQPPGIWDGLAAHLRGLAAEVGQVPKAILVISGHWEARIPTVLEAGTHRLYYDYSGFPPHTYHLEYPAPGAPELAARARALLAAAGIETAGERRRGLDHGVFIPLMLMYPAADIPVLQISLQADLAPVLHIEIGRALAPLRDEGVLIVGSGMSCHNVRALMQGPAAEAVAASAAFDGWLTGTVTGDPATREARLAVWATAPGARLSHPREEHLLPLMVAAGAASGETARRIYSERLGGLAAISGYRFG